MLEKIHHDKHIRERRNCRIDNTLLICDFTAREARDYRDLLISNYSLSTAQNRLNRAKTVFSFALKKRWIQKNPFEKIKIEIESDDPDKVFALILKQISIEFERKMQRIEEVFLHIRYANNPYPKLVQKERDKRESEVKEDYESCKAILYFIRYAGLRTNEKVVFEKMPLENQVKISKNNIGFRFCPIFPEIKPYINMEIWGSNPLFSSILRKLKVDKAKFIDDCQKKRLDELVKENFDLLFISFWFGIKPKILFERYKDIFETQIKKACIKQASQDQ